MSSTSYTKEQLEAFDLDKIKDIKSLLKIKSNLRNKDKLINLIMEEQNEPGKHSKKNVRKTTKKKKEIKYDTSILKKISRKKRSLKSVMIDKNDNLTKLNIKNKVLNFIDKLHNHLYTYESIVNTDAMNDIIMLFLIKYINENKDTFQIFNKDYYEDIDFEKFLKNHRNTFEQFLNFEINIKDVRPISCEGTDFILLLGKQFKKHKMLKYIFTVDNFINAKKFETIKELMNEFKNTQLNFKEVEDLMGEIYEYFLNKYGRGKSKLGQFFTPRKLMKCVLEIHSNKFKNITKNTINIYDPCMGTAGFLVYMYKFLEEQNKDVNINMYGNEIEPTTFKYSNINILNTIPNFKPDNLFNEDSVAYIRDFKVDYIFTNPPFGTNSKNDVGKGKDKKSYLEYDFRKNKTNDYNKMKFDEIYKLDDKNMPIQVLETCIWKLNDGGFCNIVLPYGELFFSDRYKDARNHFMKVVDIQSIILVPGGVFTHTGIKTCIVSFVKSSEGTKNIEYMEINKECTEVTNLITISKNDISKEPNNSWYLQDYVEDDYIDNLKEKINCDWIIFGDLFSLEEGTVQSNKVEEVEQSNNILINWSLYNKYKKIKHYKFDGENLFISHKLPNGNEQGYLVVKYYNGKCDIVNLMSRLVPLEKYKNKINLKYVYYFLLDMKEHIEDYYQKGSCNKSLDIKNFNRMEVPIPSLTVQNKLVEYYDHFILF